MINQQLLNKIREYVTLLEDLEEKGGAPALIKEAVQAEFQNKGDENSKDKKSIISLAVRVNEIKKEVKKIAENDTSIIVLYHQLVLAENLENFSECIELKTQIENYKKEETKS